MRFFFCSTQFFTNHPLNCYGILSLSPRKPHLRGRISTVDLLVPKLILISKILFTFVTKQPALMRGSIVLFTLVTKQAALMRRSMVLSLSLQLAFPDCLSCLAQMIKELHLPKSWTNCSRSILHSGRIGNNLEQNSILQTISSHF